MLHELSPAKGSHAKRRRVGRGNGSGRGTYSGRGSKGQRARSKVRRTFEGGQVPLVKKMPALRGFTNRFRTEYQPVNLTAIDRLAKSEVSVKDLLNSRLARKPMMPIKVLGFGEVTQAITVHAHAFSSSAKRKIEETGGSIVTVPLTHKP